MKREDLINQTKIISFPRGKYYYIKNLFNDQCLSVYKSPQSQKHDFSFEKLDNFNLFQLWMIQEIAQEAFQIVHPQTSLVLEHIQNIVKLTPNRLKNSQTFWLQNSKSQFQSVSQNVFTIKEFKSSKKYLHIDQNKLKCLEKPLFKDDCNKWKILGVTNHSLISQTCLIENYRSGLFLQVYQSRQAEGQDIVQSALNNHFHQKWKIIKKDEFFAFQSLKTGFVIDIKNEKTKEGSTLIQWKFKDSPNQKWILQKHGKRIFIIRSVMDKSLMLGIQANSLKDEANLVVTRNEGQAFWRILGNFDI